jgi:nitrite reductase/ring-hydroxylating ferredoxin subunit
MTSAMSNPDIARMARNGVGHAVAGTTELVDDILTLDASLYTDKDRFKLEVDRIFKRLPLVLAPSCELPNPGDFKTLEVVGVPVLLVRGSDGTLRSFVNSCKHRGANVTVAEKGNAKRFTCPFHGWTYGQKGELLAVASSGDFGPIDKSCHGLTALPVAERAGLIFGSVDPDSKIDIDGFLQGYDKLLEAFDIKNWHYFTERRIPGPNWKTAFDGFIDFYHLPVLHKDSFGPKTSNRAIYHTWGPHQRLVHVDREIAGLANLPESEWDDALTMRGIWTIFPCISIGSLDGGARGMSVTQLLPGETVGTSWTTQMFIFEKEPNEETAKLMQEQVAFIEHVVRDEDYSNGIRQQRALDSGALKTVMFGRNEGGNQTFHHWVERVVNASDDELVAMFPRPHE